MRVLLLLCAALVCGVGHAENQYVRAQGTGATFEQAKAQAFRQAVELEIGVLVLSDRETQDYVLVKNDILAYSAGYVTDYKIVSTASTDSRHTVTLDVKVTSSKIANRILSRARSSVELQGDTLAAQYSTWIDQKQAGDKILEKVLNQYPQRAFDLVQSAAEFHVNADRDAVLVINAQLSWKKDYLTQLAQALKLLQDNQTRQQRAHRVITVTNSSIPSWVGWTGKETFYFNDATASNIIRETFMSRALRIRTSLKNNHRVVYSECMEPTDDFFLLGQYQTDVDGRAQGRTRVELVIGKNSQLAQVLPQATEVVLTVDSAVNCNN